MVWKIYRPEALLAETDLSVAIEARRDRLGIVVTSGDVVRVTG
jgi:hypothetical protein